jgi:hypothetical protein
MTHNKLIFFFLLLFIPWGSIYAQSGVVKGIVKDNGSGKPLAGAIISATSGKTLGTTKDDGVFNVTLEAGNQMLSIDLAEYGQATISVDVISGTTADAGTIFLHPLEELRLDLGTVNLNETGSEDGFESQSIQGVLSASSDIILSTAAYTFGPVMYRLRGYESNYQNVSINGFVVNDIESGVPYFSNWGGLNDVMRNAMVSSGSEPVGFLFEPVGGATRINTRATQYRSGVKGVFSLSNRSYRNRAMVTYSTGLLNNNWAFTASYSRRWSEHGYEQGTFYDAHSFFLSVEKKINGKHSLNLTALNALYHRGVAGGSTQEVYDLVNDNFYNPYWGYQNGEVRNSRVRSNNKPLVTLTHFWNPSGKIDIQTTVGYWFGKSGYTALNWYDVQDPRPDYYRKLPSYFTEQQDQVRITGMWQNNPAVSQVDWDHFYYANRKNIFTVENEGGINGNNISGLRSKYIVEDRRNDLSQFQLNSRISWDATDRLNVTGGIMADIFRGHNFNVIKDLLGGDWWLDIDQFAERDYPNNTDGFQNDLNHPNRVVREGDIFGNDYYTFQQGINTWGIARYSQKNYSLYMGGHGRYTSQWREGLMKKGLFPESSFGKSEKMNYLTWGGKAGGDYRFTGRHLVTANMLFTNNPPLFRNSFLSPRTRNTVTPGLQPESILSADVNYILRSPVFKGRLTGYYTRFFNQTEVTSFYHDEWRTLVNYAMTSIDKENYGIEAGIEMNITPELVFNGVASVGQYLWVSNPDITITQDNNSEVLSNEEVWVTYFRQSGTPQTALAAGFEYNSSRFWWVGITGSWYDQIYLDFNPVTRTKDETGYYPYWDTQKKMEPGFLLDIFAGKSWKINNYYIGLSANMSNVLNNRTFATGGFEQYRFDPQRPEIFQPKIYYYNGFNYFINMSLRF